MYQQKRKTKQFLTKKNNIMKTNLIETAYDTYLIKFQNSGNGNVICNYKDLSEALNKLNNGYILADIFRFNESKLKFERVPKNKYNMLFGWNTEVIQILEKFNLVK